MKSILKIPVLALSLLCGLNAQANSPAASGITLSQFRIVYSAAEKKGVTWSLTNNTDRAYLMQSWVRPVDVSSGLPQAESHNIKIPFLVTPPLKRVDPGEALTLRMRLTDDSLPKDRESVFYLSVKGIPSVPDKATQTGGQLVVAVVNNVKLFYRPEGLSEGGLAQAVTQLRMSRQGDELVVDNPTPFYVNLSQVKVGGKALSAELLRRLVPPKGQQRYPLVKGTKGEVEWQAVDEQNQPTPVRRQAL